MGKEKKKKKKKGQTERSLAFLLVKLRIFHKRRRHVFPHLPRYHIPHCIPKPRRKTLNPPLLRRRGSNAADARRCQSQRGQRIVLQRY